MALPVKLEDGSGTGSLSRVDFYGAQYMQQRTGPPYGINEEIQPFTAYLTNDAGSREMNVVATPASPQVFSLDADTRDDIYIVSLQFIISGATAMDFGGFGDGPELTNPCILQYKKKDGFVVLDDELFRNSSYVLLARGNPPFGNRADAFKTLNPAGGNPNAEGYIPSVNFSETYGLQFGVRLAAGSRIGLEHVVRDDTTSAQVFRARAYGFRRSPDGTEG